MIETLRIDEGPTRSSTRDGGAVVSAGRALVPAGAVLAAVVTSDQGDWAPAGLVVTLLVLAVAGQLLSPVTGLGRVGPSVSVTTVAMVLLGPLSAAVVAAAAVLAWAVRVRPPWPRVADALAAHPALSVAGALAFAALDVAAGADPVRTVVVVCLVYLAISALNFLLVWGPLWLRERESVRGTVRSVLVPALPWELATGVLTGAAVVAYGRNGLPVLILLVAGLWAVQLCSSSVLRLWFERNDLRAQVDEFRALHVGVIRVMVESMGMRDGVTARHSAAVARLARATAAAAGLSTRDQELVHTAGLLHDIGKFTFPDHALVGGKLTEHDWELIRSHPQRGADLIRGIHGFEEVAELVLCSHERIDGRGYPRRLAGERIPELARILAIAETFHAMTAHDSYRPPRSFGDALAELRRVAGTQLDGRLVEIFTGVVAGAGVDLGPADERRPAAADAATAHAW